MMVSLLHRLPILAGTLALFGLATPVWAQTAAEPNPPGASAEAPSPITQGLMPPVGAPLSFADLAERLAPSVVNISTRQQGPVNPLQGMDGLPPGSPFEEFFEEFFDRQQENRGQSLGSGFVIDATNGYIVTNKHVVEKAETITVAFSDAAEAEAELVGSDSHTDLAVLKIKDISDLGGHRLTAVPWGDSDRIRIGDWVIAIGNPFGLGGTVTQGIISQRGRNINAGRYDDFLQTDASINRGNSGGPMFNLAGEVIGINTAIFSPSQEGGSVGIGFAIPSNMAQRVVGQLIEFGRTRRGWLGVMIQSIDAETADALGLDKPEGVLVSGVNPSGPAMTAGIKDGDVILSLDGRPMKDPRTLTRSVAETLPGTQVQVEVLRQDERLTLTVTMAEFEEAEERGLLDDGAGSGTGESGTEEPRATALLDAIGIEVAELTEPLREEYQIEPDVEGVVVTRIVPEGPSAGKLEVGDVIVQVSQIDVASIADTRTALDRVLGTPSRPNVLVQVRRKGEPLFHALQLQR